MSTPSTKAGDHAPGPGGSRTTRLLALAVNPVGLLGFALIVVSLMLLLTFALFEIVTTSANPYLDVFGYLILPSVFVAGLVIVPLGMLLELRRRRRHARRTGGATPLPRIDFNDSRTRGAVILFVGVTFFVVLPVLGVSSYHGYIYTESTAFCGQVCHSVMEPQATAHAASPHARVTCASCHIGEGASWFVKAKLSGLRQVLATWRDTYSRPIPPAITELRPARETCEQCHWPQKFFGSQYREIVHFGPDEASTRRVVRMLLKTGGADESTWRIEGIHMHMLWSGPVEYVARDEGLQDVPWVRYHPPGAEPVIYRSDGLPADDPAPAGIVRRVDCMDCHNRGAHHFRSPQVAVNLALETGRIDPTLPFIKREAVAVLTGKYADRAAADQGIADGLQSFYRTNYPDVWSSRAAAITAAVAAVKGIYRRDFFPEMKVDWRTYPENIGHMDSPGCFRCHDGRHVNKHGEHISSGCEVCHDFLNPVEGVPNAYAVGPFQHSMSLVMHPNLRCNQCHSGGSLMQCRDCHASGTWLDEAGKERFRTEGD